MAGDSADGVAYYSAPSSSLRDVLYPSFTEAGAGLGA